jgi:hypothetical protein
MALIGWWRRDPMTTEDEPAMDECMHTVVSDPGQG